MMKVQPIISDICNLTGIYIYKNIYTRTCIHINREITIGFAKEDINSELNLWSCLVHEPKRMETGCHLATPQLDLD